MAPLIARFWPTLRCAFAPSRLPSPRLCRAVIATSRRQYATLESRAPAGRSSQGPHSAIIIPASVKQTAAALIEHIKPLPVDRQHLSLCVIFVTPAFARWLSRDNTFVEDLVNRLYGLPGGAGEEDTVRAICAVVDALPVLRYTVAGSVSHGYEGIAYTVLPRVHTHRKPKNSHSELATIEFVVGQIINGKEVVKDTVHIPLANTVFQNGARTTLFDVLLRKEAPGTSFRLEARQDTSYQQLLLTLDEFDTRERAWRKTSLSIPLVPLTLPRRVGGCMGNIIRRVIGVDGEQVTASMELESIVPRYFKARNEPAQTTTAWALVFPPEMEQTITRDTEKLIKGIVTSKQESSSADPDEWAELWRDPSAVWNGIASSAVQSGARLHRVLSGGGGWGKKAGILSLDPVPSIAVPKGKEATETSPANDPDDFASTLTPVVRDGDFIQFFTTPASDFSAKAGEHDNEKDLESSFNATHGRTWSLQLGTVPSTMDSTPGQTWQHAATASDKIFRFTKTFGALVEGGLTVVRERTDKHDKRHIFSMDHISTIDVPFSRYSAIPWNTWVNAAVYRSQGGSKPVDWPSVRGGFPKIRGLTIERAARFYKLQMTEVARKMKNIKKDYDNIARRTGIPTFVPKNRPLERQSSETLRTGQDHQMPEKLTPLLVRKVQALDSSSLHETARERIEKARTKERLREQFAKKVAKENRMVRKYASARVRQARGDKDQARKIIRSYVVLPVNKIKSDATQTNATDVTQTYRARIHKRRTRVNRPGPAIHRFDSLPPIDYRISVSKGRNLTRAVPLRVLMDKIRQRRERKKLYVAQRRKQSARKKWENQAKRRENADDVVDLVQEWLGGSSKEGKNP